jgi:hypothetical protein
MCIVHAADFFIISNQIRHKYIFGVLRMTKKSGLVEKKSLSETVRLVMNKAQIKLDIKMNIPLQKRSRTVEDVTDADINVNMFI